MDIYILSCPPIAGPIAAPDRAIRSQVRSHWSDRRPDRALSTQRGFDFTAPIAETTRSRSQIKMSDLRGKIPDRGKTRSRKCPIADPIAEGLCHQTIAKTVLRATVHQKHLAKLKINRDRPAKASETTCFRRRDTGNSQRSSNGLCHTTGPRPMERKPKTESRRKASDFVHKNKV